MSTKNLARTVIEGGRARGNKWDRNYSHKEERAGSRAFLAKIKNDPEVADEIPDVARRVVSQGFTDKLNPAKRFLKSRVGKSWAKTRSLIAEKFDIRTTAGRHVVHDHMLKEIAPNKAATEINDLFNRYNYFVDKHGILRELPRRHREKQKPEPLPCSKDDICKWLGDRKIKKCGDAFVWLEKTDPKMRVRAFWLDWPNMLRIPGVDRIDWPGGVRYLMVDEKDKPIIEKIEYPTSAGRGYFKPSHLFKFAMAPYRQGKLLNKKDMEFFKSFPDWAQKTILDDR